MKTAELTNLTKEELEEKVVNLRKELFDLRMQAGGGKLDKPHAIQQARKTIARILTMKRLSAMKDKAGGSV